MTTGSRSDEAKRVWGSPAQRLLAIAELAIIAAGVVLLFAANGRWWVILAASLAFLVGFILGMLALVAEL
jgi:hypothetical protein